MSVDKEFIIEQFKAIKARGFIPSKRTHNTGIGKTFEDYIGVEENNSEAPDLAGFEIKSHRSASSSLITLFTKAPSGPQRANVYLNSNYGEPYDEFPSLKKIHTSITVNYNSFANKYAFKMYNAKEENKIKICIHDLASKELLDDKVFYSYSDIESKLHLKLKNLLYVTAESRRDSNNNEEFHFTKAEIYTNPSFEKLMELLEVGKIIYDIRIGCYQSGSKYGKTHDHGSGFRIKESDLVQLYQDYELIE